MRRNGEPTENWRLSLGTSPGYELDGQEPMSEDSFARLYLECAEEVFTETGVYVSAVFHRARMLYRGEWGCPDTGEYGYELHGCRNPLFAEREAYLAALELLVEKLKARFRQSAVYLELSETVLYFNYID